MFGFAGGFHRSRKIEPVEVRTEFIPELAGITHGVNEFEGLAAAGDFLDEFHRAHNSLGCSVFINACLESDLFRLGGLVFKTAHYLDHAVFNIGINLNRPKRHCWQRLQRDAPDDAVPVALGVVAHAVRVESNVHEHPVIHADGEQVPAGFCDFRQVIAVWCGQADMVAQRAVVEPGGCGPVAPFEREDDPLTFPGRRDPDLALIPGGSNVIEIGLQPERDLDVPGLAVFLIFIGRVPRLVDDLSRPLRIHPHGKALAVRIKTPRQVQCVIRELSQVILLVFPLIEGVDDELPGTGQVFLIFDFGAGC